MSGEGRGLWVCGCDCCVFILGPSQVIRRHGPIIGNHPCPITLSHPHIYHPSLHTLPFIPTSHPSLHTLPFTPSSSHPPLHTLLFTPSSHPPLHTLLFTPSSSPLLFTPSFTPSSSHPCNHGMVHGCIHFCYIPVWEQLLVHYWYTSVTYLCPHSQACTSCQRS